MVNRRTLCMRRSTRRANLSAQLLTGASLAATLLFGRPSLAQEGKPPGTGARLEPVFQELFLGELVFPQEQGEFQFTTGYCYAHRRDRDFQLPLLLEYGITNRFQVAAAFPIEFLYGETARPTGLGNVELEAYYTFVNDASAGRACGAGFAVGLPSATSGVGHRALRYEPILVAYQEFDAFAVNGFAGLEIEDPLSGDEPAQLGGQLGMAAFKQVGPLVPVLELLIEIEADESRARLAPGLYWRPHRPKKWELGVALPVGLTGDTPAFGVILLATWEFARD